MRWRLYQIIFLLCAYYIPTPLVHTQNIKSNNLFMKQSEVTKYLGLITSIANNRTTNYPNRFKNNRYKQIIDFKSSVKQDELLPEYSQPRIHVDPERERRRNLYASKSKIADSYSEGDLGVKQSDRNNLYQIYCEQLKRKKSQNKYLPSFKQNNSSHVVDIAENIVIEEDERLNTLRQIHKSKSLKVQNQLYKKKQPQKTYQQSKRKLQPGQLTIGPATSFKMPKIDQRNGNIAELRHSYKLPIGAKHAKPKFDGLPKHIRYMGKLDGWDAVHEQEQQFSRFYFHP